MRALTLAVAALAATALLAFAPEADAAHTRYPAGVTVEGGRSIAAHGDAADACRQVVEVVLHTSATEPPATPTEEFAAGDTVHVWIQAQQGGTCSGERVNVIMWLVSEDGAVPSRNSWSGRTAGSTYGMLDMRFHDPTQGAFDYLGPLLCTQSTCVEYETYEQGNPGTSMWKLGTNEYDHYDPVNSLQVGTWGLVVCASWRDTLDTEQAAACSDECPAAGCSNELGAATQGYVRARVAASLNVEESSCASADTKFLRGETVCLSVADGRAWKLDPQWNNSRVADLTVGATESSNRFDFGVSAAACGPAKCLLVGEDVQANGHRDVWGLWTTTWGVIDGSPFQINPTTLTGCGTQSRGHVKMVYAEDADVWALVSRCAAGTEENVFWVNSAGVREGAQHKDVGTTSPEIAWTSSGSTIRYEVCAYESSTVTTCQQYDDACPSTCYPLRGSEVDVCANSCKDDALRLTGGQGTGAFWVAVGQTTAPAGPVVTKIDTTGATGTQVSATGDGIVYTLCASKTHFAVGYDEAAVSNQVMAFYKVDGTSVETVTITDAAAGMECHVVNGDMFLFRDTASANVKVATYAMDTLSVGLVNRQTSPMFTTSEASAPGLFRISGGVAVQSESTSTFGNSVTIAYYWVEPTQAYGVKVRPTGAAQVPVRNVNATGNDLQSTHALSVSGATNGYEAEFWVAHESQIAHDAWTYIDSADTRSKKAASVTLTDPDGGSYSVQGFGVEDELTVTVGSVDCHASLTTTDYCNLGEDLRATLTVTDEWGEHVRSGLSVKVTPKMPSNGDVASMARSASVGASGAFTYVTTALPTSVGAGLGEDTYASAAHSQAEAKNVVFTANFPTTASDSQGAYGESAGAFDLDDDYYRETATVAWSTVMYNDVNRVTSTWRNVRGENVPDATSVLMEWLDPTPDVVASLARGTTTGQVLWDYTYGSDAEVGTWTTRFTISRNATNDGNGYDATNGPTATVSRTIGITGDDLDVAGQSTTQYFVPGDSIRFSGTLAHADGGAYRRLLADGSTQDRAVKVRYYHNAVGTNAWETASLTIPKATGVIPTSDVTVPTTAADTYASTTHGVLEATEYDLDVYDGGTGTDGLGNRVTLADYFDVDAGNNLHGDIHHSRYSDGTSDTTAYTVPLDSAWVNSTWRNVRGELLSGATVNPCTYTVADATATIAWSAGTTDANGRSSTKKVLLGYGGANTISCSASWNDLSGSETETLTVFNPDIEDPLKVFASVPAKVDEAVRFSVTSTYLNGTGRTGAAASIFLDVYNAAGTKVVSAQNPTEIGRGAYRYSYTPTTTGDYDVVAWFTDADGHTVVATHAFYVEDATTGGGGGSLITVNVGGDAYVDAAIPLVITATGTDGAVRTGAAASIFLKVKDPDGTLVVNAANPTEWENGVYESSFTPTKVGNYKVLAYTTLSGSTYSHSTTVRVLYDPSVNHTSLANWASAAHTGQNTTLTGLSTDHANLKNWASAAHAGQNTTYLQPSLDDHDAIQGTGFDTVTDSLASLQAEHDVTQGYVDGVEGDLTAVLADTRYIADVACPAPVTGTVCDAVDGVEGYVDDLESRLTAPRAANLDNLDATVSSRESEASAATRAATDVDEHDATQASLAEVGGDTTTLSQELDDHDARDHVRAVAHNTTLGRVEEDTDATRENLAAHDIGSAHAHGFILDNVTQIHDEVATDDASEWYETTVYPALSAFKDPEYRAKVGHEVRVATADLAPSGKAEWGLLVTGLGIAAFAGSTRTLYSPDGWNLYRDDERARLRRDRWLVAILILLLYAALALSGGGT